MQMHAIVFRLDEMDLGGAIKVFHHKATWTIPVFSYIKLRMLRFVPALHIYSFSRIQQIEFEVF